MCAPIALFTSLYLQRVKAGIALADPTDLAESYARSAEFDYVPVIEAYIDTFGADAVRVREFVPSAFEGGSLMADVWSFLDLPAPLLQQAEVLGRDVVNPTPTAEQAFVLIALARRARAAMGSAFHPRALRRSLAYLLTELRARLPGQATRYRLPMDLQSAIADHMDGPARPLPGIWIVSQAPRSAPNRLPRHRPWHRSRFSLSAMRWPPWLTWRMNADGRPCRVS